MEQIIEFLKKLAENNNREWFSAHKSEFENAKKQADNFFYEIYQQMQHEDILGDIKIYRIYRDMRFSKDKTPFKTHFGLYFPRKQPHYRGGYYLHLSPTESFAAGGFYNPSPPDLKRIRTEIDLYPEEFSTIMQTEEVKTYFGGRLWGDALKTIPKGFENPNSLIINHLRQKQFILKRDFKTEDLFSPSFQTEIIKSFKAMRPFYDFMTTALTTDANGESIF